MLNTIKEEQWLQPTGVYGLFPANAKGEDIAIFKDEDRKEIASTLYGLRQQVWL